MSSVALHIMWIHIYEYALYICSYVVYVHMCVFVWCLCPSLYDEGRGGHWLSCSIILSFESFRQDLSLNLELDWQPENLSDIPDSDSP